MALEILDRVPTKPGRVLITPEDSSEPFYAVVTRADEPSQEGSPINKELLDNMTKAENIGVSAEVQEMLGVDNVDDGLKNVRKIVPVSYLAFITSANTNTLDAAFGKNNESDIYNIGKALAMYSNFYGESLNFDNLKKCDSLSDILSSIESIKQLINSQYIKNVLVLSDYALNTLLYSTEQSFSGGITGSSSVYEQSYTVTLTITDEHLQKGIVAFYTEVSGDSRGTFGISYTFNSASIGSLSISGSGKNIVFFDLENYGITTPGDYDIVFSVSRNGRGYSFNCTTNIRLFN